MRIHLKLSDKSTHEVEPRTLKRGDFITFADQTSGYPPASIFHRHARHEEGRVCLPG